MDWEQRRIGYIVYVVTKIMNNKGFTLFELLVSISIIGIMVALAVISYSGAQKKARDARRIQDMNMIQKAAEEYYSLSTNYPYPTSETNMSFWTVGGVQMLQQWPTDPKGVGGTQYSYRYGVGSTYCSCAAVENQTNGNSTNDWCAFAASGPYYCVTARQ